MHIDLGKLRDPYQPGAGPVVQPWIQPRRRTLLTFRHYWPWVSLATTMVLIVLATLPIQQGWYGFYAALMAAGCYTVAAMSFDLADRQIKAPVWQQRLRVIQKISFITALTAVHWLLPAASTELWLLYLIPMLTVGVDLDRAWALGLVVFTMVLLFFSAWSLTDSTAYLRTGAIRALMGGYVGATSYLLARSLAYQTNTLREGLSRLLDATITDRWLNAANAVARIIADLLSETSCTVTVNVLAHERTSDHIRLVGSSTPAGQALAETGFTFAVKQGITGWAAQRQRPCFINDTANDPEQRFLPNAAFPGTRSALAVPIPLDAKHTAVLEIESPIPHDVAYEDLQLMNHVAHYLLATHQRSELLALHQQLVRLGAELAERIIQVEEIGAMLEKIGSVALDLLNADVIRFYYRHPESGRIEQRRTIGELRHPNAEGSPANDPQSIVTQLMEEGRFQTFPDPLSDPRLTRRLQWHQQRHCEPFVIREGIQACAAMPLIVGQEKLGLMWVNYRRTQEFSPALCTSIQLLAPYAALAIKSGVQSALNEKKRRGAMRRIVHDALAHRLHDVARGLESLDKYPPASPIWKAERMIVQCQVERARRVVDNLVGERPWLTLQSIVDDLKMQAQWIEKLYQIAVQFTGCPAPVTPITMSGGNELMFACDEILGNAVCHSQATMLSITVDITNDLLHICVADNGVGFDTSRVRLGQGIASIRDRIHRLNGLVHLCSDPGRGTVVYLAVPITAEKQS